MRVQPGLFLLLSCFVPCVSSAQTAIPTVTPPREPGLYAKIETSLGTITARLYETETPATVQNFTALAAGRKSFKDPKTGAMVRRPFYNGIAIHRVIPGFMIQMGDPTGTGAYEPGFTIPDEFHPSLKFDRPGRLGMANTGDRNSGNCQFFITDAPTPHLNNLHTVFGQVVEGQDVVKRIAGVPRDAENKPRAPVTIKSVVMERVGPEPAKPPAVNKAPAKK
jgi:peptidyl-prolyl cis-trans isomerase A (cyclophilin A)